MRNCRACQRNTTHSLPMASGDDFLFSIIYIFFKNEFPRIRNQY